jgi:hypothetical protein
MRASTLFLAAAILLHAPAARAINVTDCTSAPVTTFNKKTVIDLPADDVVIQCPLMALAGTDAVRVIAKSIVVDGPAGGAISASGKGLAIELVASGDIVLDAAAVVAADNNGKIQITAGGNILTTDGSSIQSGRMMNITCTGPGCTMSFAGTTIATNQLFITAEGDITFLPTTQITTRCPRDLIVIVSNGGDVILANAGAGLGVDCCQQAIDTCANPLNPACPFSQPGGQVCLTTLPQLTAFCSTDCQRPPNKFRTCVEGNLTILAPNGSIDLTGAQIQVGEAITFTAAFDVIMENASIQNCGAKTGVFKVTATTCHVENATLLDDEPEPMPTLMCVVTGTPAQLGTCSAKHPQP